MSGHHGRAARAEKSQDHPSGPALSSGPGDQLSPVTVVNAAGRKTHSASRCSALILIRFDSKYEAWLFDASTVTPPRNINCAAVENAPTNAVPAPMALVTTTGFDQIMSSAPVT